MNGISFKKIVITGPESSGKSSLTQALSDQLRIPAAPEYARLYLSLFGPQYQRDDLAHMAHGQVALEVEAAMRSKGFFLCDTSLEVIYIWWEMRFGPPPTWLSHLMERHLGHFYLLCAPDITWVPDPLREHPYPHQRSQLFARYQRLLESLGVPYGVVQGQGPKRLQCALELLYKAPFSIP